MTIEIRKLSEQNIADYEALTTLDKEKPCYCSWWHIKPIPMDQYDLEKKTNPSKFRDCVLSKMRVGFHVGVIAYEAGEPIAWVSVGLINEFHWAFSRSVKLGEAAAKTAGIMCFNTHPKHRGKGKTVPILNELAKYGQNQGWQGIESYPFDRTAIDKHGDPILWPGTPEEYSAAGFERVESHWLSGDDYARSIFYRGL
jgi:hypothetical protein